MRTFNSTSLFFLWFEAFSAPPLSLWPPSGLAQPRLQLAFFLLLAALLSALLWMVPLWAALLLPLASLQAPSPTTFLEPFLTMALGMQLRRPSLAIAPAFCLDRWAEAAHRHLPPCTPLSRSPAVFLATVLCWPEPFGGRRLSFWWMHRMFPCSWRCLRNFALFASWCLSRTAWSSCRPAPCFGGADLQTFAQSPWSLSAAQYFWCSRFETVSGWAVESCSGGSACCCLDLVLLWVTARLLSAMPLEAAVAATKQFWSTSFAHCLNPQCFLLISWFWLPFAWPGPTSNPLVRPTDARHSLRFPCLYLANLRFHAFWGSVILSCFLSFSSCQNCLFRFVFANCRMSYPQCQTVNSDCFPFLWNARSWIRWCPCILFVFLAALLTPCLGLPFGVAPLHFGPGRLAARQEPAKPHPQDFELTQESVIALSMPLLTHLLKRFLTASRPAEFLSRPLRFGFSLSYYFPNL